AAKQLTTDNVDVLHTIGGDDTNTTAADLAAYLQENDYALTVVGLPKTIDNDVIPIKQSLGAWTAAEEGARYFANVVAEATANPRMLIVHEVMGRHCGWLTAATAAEYRKLNKQRNSVPGLSISSSQYDVHAVYVPELEIDIDAEAQRLSAKMDQVDNINIFIAEGAGVESIVALLEKNGEDVPRDAFGHVKLDAINPGAWFAQQFAEKIGADKVLVQKSGYYGRSAPANAEDLRLIKSCTDLAVDCAMRGEGGVIGHDDDQNNILRAIEFARIAGGKPFNTDLAWFTGMLEEIEQPLASKAQLAAH
ncbi:MAG: pyrophosphate--fructose-6-phosphate 1-phosphotransferase, partial [Planctomycetes bacterium]|nr:pyrophosphate--fructose-6-phosphate 1-phosphotransferase [Planctomycetota bacterium]